MHADIQPRLTDNASLNETRTGLPGAFISSLRIEKNPRHWRITVFNRGGNAGTLCVDAADGPRLAALLLPSTGAAPHE